ncbi:MAG TPA: MFS transporter [Caulobacteraceae bacterium]|jgi:MFS family permease|nr:MFS transporter [Caulobacteraceae bacterium]
MDRPQAGEVIETTVPARLDALPWSRFHWLVAGALGVAWILDGLEVTLVGALSSALRDPHALALGEAQVGLTASAYLLGAVVGAVVFGRLTDRFGRKRLFTLTVGLYLLATAASGLAWNFPSFLLFRCLTGAGIGGEYAAVNSAVQELIPARRRGFTDLVINGSYWIGAAVGALGSVVALDPHIFPPALGWRLAFLIGAGLGLVTLYVRRFIPESPRWLMTHGRPEEAERVVAAIEAGVAARGGLVSAAASAPVLKLRRAAATSWLAVARALVVVYPRRTLVGLTLMASQAFCYNAIFFTYALILTKFYGVPAGEVGWFLLPFALGNFAGPLTLGALFDSLGRRLMIASTYALAGVLLAITGALFAAHLVDAVQQTAAWTVIFFFASAGASAAYLTVGESFPLEIRAVAIALFYAVGTGLGGVAAPALFGVLIGQGSRGGVLAGYLVGAAAMMVAAGVQLAFGLDAERKPLETLAPPLSLLH